MQPGREREKRERTRVNNPRATVHPACKALDTELCEDIPCLCAVGASAERKVHAVEITLYCAVSFALSLSPLITPPHCVRE